MPTVPTPNPMPRLADLTDNLRTALLSGLNTEISLDVPSFEIYGSIHATEVEARFTLGGYLGDLADDPQLTAFVHAHGGSIEVNYGRVTIPVGDARLILVNLLQAQAAFDGADEASEEASRLAAYALGYTDEVDPDDYGAGAMAILVMAARVAPAFQGHEIGLFGTAAAMRPFIPGSAFAALMPMAPGTEGDNARRRSRQRLTAYWSRLGFETVGENGNMILDFAHVLPSPYFDDPNEN